MKPVVVGSHSDTSGDRCVDILRLPDGEYAWVACRRDPEDSHGWRHLHPPLDGYADAESAMKAARASNPWLENET